MRGLEKLQLKSRRHFPWLGAFPDPYDPVLCLPGWGLGRAPRAGEGNQRASGGERGAEVLASKARGRGGGERREGERRAAPLAAALWKTRIDRALGTCGLAVLLQCLCSDGKLTNSKSKLCFQAVQKLRISKQAFSRYLKFSELFLSWVLRC